MKGKFRDGEYFSDSIGLSSLQVNLLLSPSWPFLVSRSTILGVQGSNIITVDCVK
jgi:hypothetical protein